MSGFDGRPLHNTFQALPVISYCSMLTCKSAVQRAECTQVNRCQERVSQSSEAGESAEQKRA